MLQPKRLKYRKQQKGRNKGLAYRGSSISFGTFGLKAVTAGRLTDRQIEAARVAMTRHMKREGNVWIRIFLISRLRQNQQRFVWVKVKEPWIIM